MFIFCCCRGGRSQSVIEPEDHSSQTSTSRSGEMNGRSVTTVSASYEEDGASVATNAGTASRVSSMSKHSIGRNVESSVGGDAASLNGLESAHSRSRKASASLDLRGNDRGSSLFVPSIAIVDYHEGAAYSSEESEEEGVRIEPLSGNKERSYRKTPRLTHKAVEEVSASGIGRSGPSESTAGSDDGDDKSISSEESEEIDFPSPKSAQSHPNFIELRSRNHPS